MFPAHFCTLCQSLLLLCLCSTAFEITLLHICFIWLLKQSLKDTSVEHFSIQEHTITKSPAYLLVCMKQSRINLPKGSLQVLHLTILLCDLRPTAALKHLWSHLLLIRMKNYSWWDVSWVNHWQNVIKAPNRTRMTYINVLKNMWEWNLVSFNWCFNCYLSKFRGWE